MGVPQGHGAPSTGWLPRKGQGAKPPPAPKPASTKALVSPAAPQGVGRWVGAAVGGPRGVHQMGRVAGRGPNGAPALPQGGPYPKARGVRWGLRNAHRGVAAPLGPGAPLGAHPNVGRLRWQCGHGYLGGHPGQGLLPQLVLGVWCKGSLGMQIALLPHPTPFAGGCKQAQAGVEALAPRVWHPLHPLPPHVPPRGMPRGPAPKANGGARPTSGAGAPRGPGRGRPGRPVAPQGGPTKGAKWPKGWGATMAVVVWAMCVLVAAAQCATGPPARQAAGGGCRNQLGAAPGQHWAAGTLLLGGGGAARWAAGRVVPPGAQCAPNAAQAWARSLVPLVRQRWVAWGPLQQRLVAAWWRPWAVRGP